MENKEYENIDDYYGNEKKKKDQKRASNVVMVMVAILTIFRMLMEPTMHITHKFFIPSAIGAIFFAVIMITIPSGLIALVIKKEFRKVVVFVGVIYIAFLLLSIIGGIGLSVKADETEKVAGEKIYSMANGILSGDEIAKEDIDPNIYGDATELVEVSQEMFLNYQVIASGFKREMDTVDINTFLSEEEVTEKGALAKSRIRLNYLIEYTDEYVSDISDNISEYKEKLDNLAQDNKYNADFIEGFMESFEKMPEKLTYQQKAIKDIFISTDRILEFLEGADGEYWFEEGYISFDYQEDVDRYNELIEDLNDSIIHLGTVIDQHVNETQNKLDEMKETVTE